ncbi:MAG: hypothetical protein F6K36_22280 [Symploca sp. SIO3C6]|nr:hypothetical protein [Symploca sp. SIO3C6]
MKSSSFKPSAHNRLHEYRHCDPPGLWFAAIMFSVVIHFFAFWLLRLLPMGRFLKWHSGITPIPVEFISIDSKVVLPTPKAHNSVTTITTEKSEQSLNSVIASASSASATSPNSVDLPIIPTPEISPSFNQPQVKPKPTPSPTIISPNQTQAIPKPSPTIISPNQTQAIPKPSPTIISPNQTQVTPQPSPTLVPTPNPNQQPLNEIISTEPNLTGDSVDEPKPATSSFPSPIPETQSPSPIASPSTKSTQEEAFLASQQQGGGFLVSLSDLRLSVADRDIPTQLAQPKIERQEFTAADYGLDLDFNIDSDLVLEVLLIIDHRGIPSMLPEEPPQVLQGASKMRAEELMQLVEVIIDEWEFEPTYMEHGAVDQAYYVKLAISPL